MSTQDINTKEQTPQKIVRLKVDGARNTVNTLSDQQTKRGVSLICPFPALEVNISASFGSTAEGGMQNGTIHRIGVEDDPATGLPRLRLSIRSDDDRSTIIKQPSIELIDESSRFTKPEEPIFEEKPSQRNDSLFDISCEDQDPDWVNCDEIPLPEEFLARSKTRRRYNMVRKAVYMALLIVVVGAGFVAERTGVVSVDDVRSYVAGLSINSKPEKKADTKIEVEAPALEEIATVDATDSVPIPVETTAAAMPMEEPTVNEQAPIVELASAKVVQEEEIPAPEPASEPEAKPEVPTNSETIANEITIVLPTRWPVEYASGYRIRDPNGVVIDVPGGLVKKTGWLEAAADHPMIRSIKSIQRETGARFVVYVNGELPRFMTSPKTEGVSLRLYDMEAEAITSQEVAMAD